MSDFAVSLLMIYTYLMGIILGYIIWAPMTQFKRSFLNGIALKFLWKRKR